MTKTMIPLLALLWMAISCVSKDSLKKTLKENPDILAEAIKENPKEIMEALQEAAMATREQMAKEREQQQEEEFLKSFENPFKPQTEGHIVRGNPNGPIVIVEYSDFQCPFCERGYNTVQSLLEHEKYQGKVAFIYKHLPLENHPEAMPAALYFEAIAEQSPEKAWKFHDQLFQNQRQVSKGVGFFKAVAKKLGVDMKKLEKDLKKSSIQDKIKAHMEEAQSFGISGTPGFLVNGIPVRGAYPIDRFEMILTKLQEMGKLTL